MSSKLYLVPTPIGNLQDFSPRAIATLKEADVIACEDTRTSRPLLEHFDIHNHTVSYHNFNEEESSKGLLALLDDGKTVAVISDAGYPLISDPGYSIVTKAIEKGHEVIALPGPNAALTALVASGLDTTHYLYYGFLSSKDSDARKQLEDLKEIPYTLIFYEAPHRIIRTLNLCKEVLNDRNAVVARELNKLHEEKKRGTLSYLAKQEYRGEIVLMIEGYKKENKEDIDILLKQVEELMNNDMSLKEACKIIAEKSSFTKNDLYRAYVAKEKE